MSDFEREFNWDDEIVKDSDFILLPEGDYNFRVTGFERGRHNGSEKLPPCNKAIITLEVESSEGKVYLQHNLFLHSKCEGLLSNFFTGIGQKRHGEPLKMNWSTVIGSTGRCKLGVRPWVNKNGEQMQSNEVKRFYEPTNYNSAPLTSASTVQPTSSQPSGVFIPGKF